MLFKIKTLANISAMLVLFAGAYFIVALVKTDFELLGVQVGVIALSAVLTVVLALAAKLYVAIIEDVLHYPYLRLTLKEAYMLLFLSVGGWAIATYEFTHPELDTALAAYLTALQFAATALLFLFIIVGAYRRKRSKLPLLTLE